VRGCAHLHELARGLGPAAVQALISWHSRNRPNTGEGQTTPSPGTFNTCHVWAAGGVGEQKLAAGWRIGRGTAYPVPPVAHFETATETATETASETAGAAAGEIARAAASEATS